MGRLSQAFQRLSKRERLLVSAMLGTLVIAIVLGLYFVLQGKIDKLETNIAQEQDSLRQIYASTGEFRMAKERFDSTRGLAQKNAELNLTTAVAELAEKISFEAVDPRTGPLGKKDLKEYLEFKGTKEKQVGPRKKKPAGAKNVSTDGYYQRDQEVTFKENIPFATIYELLERIEESGDMLFVTDMRLDRSRLDPERAGQGKIVVSTFYWQGELDE